MQMCSTLHAYCNHLPRIFYAIEESPCNSSDLPTDASDKLMIRSCYDEEDAKWHAHRPVASLLCHLAFEMRRMNGSNLPCAPFLPERILQCMSAFG